MANGRAPTPVIIPSVLGGGLSRAAEAIAQAIQERTLAEEREEEREEQTRQFDVRTAMEEERLRLTRQTNALTRLGTLGQFTDPGTMVSEVPMAQRLLNEAFPGMTPQELEELGPTMELNPQTFATMRDDILKDAVDRGLLSEDDIQAGVLAEFGVKPEDIREAENLTARLRTATVRGVLNDPDLIAESSERMAGRSPTTFQIPGTDETVSFNTEAEANLWTRLKMQNREFSFRTTVDTEDNEFLKEIVADAQDTVEEATGRRPSAIAVRRVINRFNEFQNRLGQGEEVDIEAEFMEGASPAEKATFLYLSDAIITGDRAYYDMIPERMQNFLYIAERIESMEGISQELRESILSAVTESLPPQSNVQRLREKRWFELGDRYRLEDPPIPEGEEDIQAFWNSDLGIEAATNLIMRDSLTIEELVELDVPRSVAEAAQNTADTLTSGGRIIP